MIIMTIIASLVLRTYKCNETTSLCNQQRDVHVSSTHSKWRC